MTLQEQIDDLIDRMNVEATRLKAEQRRSMTKVDDAYFFAMLAELDRLEAEEKGHEHDSTAV
jgi:hypothetical protein